MSDETRRLLEELIADNLQRMSELDIGSKERSVLQRETEMLMKALHDNDQLNLEYFDKEDKRRIEREKIQNESNLEKERKKFDWNRAVLEVGKSGGLLAAQIAAFAIFQRISINFEENGRYTSWTSKELHLPKFFK